MPQVTAKSPLALVQLCQDHGTVIVAMSIVLMMQMAVYQVIHMVAMRNRFMATTRSVNVSGIMTAANMPARTIGRIGTGRFEKFTVRRVLRHRRRRARNVLRCRMVHCGFSRACVSWPSAWMRLDFLANHRVHRRQSTHVIAKSSIGMHRLCDVLS